VLKVAGKGSLVTTCAAGDAVSVWDLASGKQLRQLKLPADTTGAALSGDAGLAATVAGSDVEIWDVAAGKRLRQFAAGQQPIVALALAADGKTLAVRDLESHVYLWDVTAGKELRLLRDEPPPAGKGMDVALTEITGVLTGEMAFSPDGRYLAGADAQHRLCLWETAGGARLWEVALPPGQVVDGVAFSANGRALAALHHDGTVEVYETGTGEKRCRLGVARARKGGGALGVMVGGQALTLARDGADAPAVVAFSPDSRFLAFSQSESVVHVWDVVAGKEVAAYPGHPGGVTAVALAADGKRVVAACLDTTALVWDSAAQLKKDLPAGEPLTAQALEQLGADLCGRDGGKAFEAMCQLLRRPAQAVALFEQQVKSVPAPDAKRVAQLIAELNHAKFDVRQKATTELEKLGDLAVPSLRKELQGDLGLEARQRVESLLKRLAQSSGKGTTVRDLRVVEWLELQGGAEARQLLEALAGGAAGARLTVEARGALERLTP
jgi:hypothetical protein